MNFIVITSPDFFPGEAHLITMLFENGVDVLHLRKPHSTVEECRRLLDDAGEDYEQNRGVPRKELFRHIVLHDHHPLCAEYGLQGVHLNSRNPTAPSFAGDHHFTLSASCHSIAEVTERKASLDYLFLSPIFDSISKEGYHSAYTLQQLEGASAAGVIDCRVIALGGVSASNLSTVRRLGFGGAAFLGDIWRHSDSPDHFASHVRLIAEQMKDDFPQILK